MDALVSLLRRAIAKYVASEKRSYGSRTLAITWLLVGVVGWIVSLNFPTPQGGAFVAVVATIGAYLASSIAAQVVCRIQI